jgi:hypothetical protein
VLKFKRRFRRAYRLHSQNLMVNQVNQNEASSLACFLIQNGFLIGLFLNSVDDPAKLWLSFSGFYFVLIQNIELFTTAARRASIPARNHWLLTKIRIWILISPKNSASVTAHHRNMFHRQTQTFWKKMKFQSPRFKCLNFDSEYGSCLCFQIVRVSLQDKMVSQSRRLQCQIYRH